MNELIIDEPARNRINSFLCGQPGNIARLYISYINGGEDVAPLLGSYDEKIAVSGFWMQMDTGRLFVSEAAAEEFGSSIITLVIEESAGNRTTQFRLKKK